MLSLAGKTALVTGGSRGIGRAVCALFGRLGARVALAYARDEKAAREAAAEVEAAGSTAVTLRADLAQDGAAERLVAAAEDALGPLDILVANHGIWKRAPIETMTLAEWDEMVRTNLGSVRALCSEAARRMGPRPVGRDRPRRVHRGPARRALPRALRRDQGRGDRTHPLARLRARAARHPGQLRRAGLGARPT